MDGSLYFVDKQGKTTKLFGHRSRVTKIKINNWQLYSSSYDGTIQLYMADKAKIEPIELFSIGNWILNFTFDSSKHNIWTANQNGTLTEVFISVPLMHTHEKTDSKPHHDDDRNGKCMVTGRSFLP